MQSLSNRLRRAWSDGTMAIAYEPLELIDRLVALVPPPGFHRVRMARRAGSGRTGVSGCGPEEAVVVANQEAQGLLPGRAREEGVRFRRSRLSALLGSDVGDCDDRGA